MWPEVSGYRVTGELGRGGFAVVYRAEQISLRREVALKVLSVLDISAEEINRFRRECESLARLDWHPNIARVLEAGLTADGRPYLAMELFEAGSVGQKFRGTPMPLEAVRELGMQAASALATAHEAGILHRDVKPDNLLIDRTGRYRLGDFGIASIVGATRSSSAGMSGTIGFLAPEVIRGERATERSDVYSLATTMYTLLTGSQPFSKSTDESVAATIARTLSEDPPDLTQHGAPEWFASVIRAAMSKDPNLRPPDASSFGEQLRLQTAAPSSPTTAETTTVQGLAGAPASAPDASELPTVAQMQPVRDDNRSVPPATSKHGGRKIVFAAAAVLTLALGGGIAATAMSGDDPQTAPTTTAAIPTTTSAPTTTAAISATTSAPTTTAAISTTTSAPTTTAAPETTIAPETTVAVSTSTQPVKAAPVGLSPGTVCAMVSVSNFDEVPLHPSSVIVLKTGITVHSDANCKVWRTGSLIPGCYTYIDGIQDFYLYNTTYTLVDGSQVFLSDLCRITVVAPATTPPTLPPATAPPTLEPAPPLATEVPTP